jgi:diadenosine tetraphosphatase ApaH/serine/threonine PP2A family protein phosphatase
MQQRHPTMKKALILAALLASVTASQAVQIWTQEAVISYRSTPLSQIGVQVYDEGETVDASVFASPRPPVGIPYYFDSNNAAPLISFLNTHTPSFVVIFLGAGGAGGELADHSGIDYLRYIIDGIHQEAGLTYYSVTLSGHAGVVPTPDAGGTAALLGLGIAGLAFARRKLA